MALKTASQFSQCSSIVPYLSPCSIQLYIHQDCSLEQVSSIRQCFESLLLTSIKGRQSSKGLHSPFLSLTLHFSPFFDFSIFCLHPSYILNPSLSIFVSLPTISSPHYSALIPSLPSAPTGNFPLSSYLLCNSLITILSLVTTLPPYTLY